MRNPVLLWAKKQNHKRKGINLSNKKALYSRLTIQRCKKQIFDCNACFPSQKQVFPYRYL